MIKKGLYIFTSVLILSLVIISSTNNKSWVIKFYVNKGEIQSRTLIYIKGDNMKIVTKDKTYLYNSKSQTLNFVDSKDQTYWQGKVKDFSKASTKIKILTDKNFLLNEVPFLKDMNSKDQKYFEEKINQRTDISPLRIDYSIYSNFNIKSTPNFTSIGEYAVRKYEVRNSGRILEEIWIAENLLTHMGWNMDDFKEFLDAFFFHSGIAPYFNLNSYMKIRKNGLPMKVIIFHNKKETVITMDHASKTKLTKETFHIPENFKLKPINQMLKDNPEETFLLK